MVNPTAKSRPWLRGALVATFFLVLSAGAAGAVALGEQAPAFSLTGHDGQTRALEQLHGEKTAVLIFFRGLW